MKCWLRKKYALCELINIPIFIIQTVSVIIPIKQMFCKHPIFIIARWSRCQGHATPWWMFRTATFIEGMQANIRVGNSSSSLNYYNTEWILQSFQTDLEGSVQLHLTFISTHASCQIDIARFSIKTFHCTCKSFNWRLIRFPN